MKKRITLLAITVFFIFSIIVIIYNINIPKQNKYVENWNIELPSDMQSIYYKYSDIGFQGDGMSYDVFKLKKSDNFFQCYSSEKNQNIEKKITEILKLLKVKDTKYPDFEKKYYWKLLEKNYADKLWIVYYPEEFELYIIQELL